MTSSGKSVSAVLHANPLTIPHCVEEDTALPFTGATDSSGNLSLTAPIAGGVATISANVLTPETITLPDGTVRNEPFFAGTFQVVWRRLRSTIHRAECFPGSQYHRQLYRYLYTAPLALPAPIRAITATFLEASAPDANGKYAFSGTITSTGGCNATYTFSSGAVSGALVQTAYFLTDTLSIPHRIPPSPIFLGSICPATPRASI